MYYKTRQRLKRFNHYKNNEGEATVIEQPEVVEVEKKQSKRATKKVEGDE